MSVRIHTRASFTELFRVSDRGERTVESERVCESRKAGNGVSMCSSMIAKPNLAQHLGVNCCIALTEVDCVYASNE